MKNAVLKDESTHFLLLKHIIIDILLMKSIKRKHAKSSCSYFEQEKVS